LFQGKGWVEAQDLESEDPYNFSVKDTPNYFAGKQGLWAHNVSCFKSRVGLPELKDGFKYDNVDDIWKRCKWQSSVFRLKR